MKFGEIFFKELDRTRATRKLRNNYFVSSTKLDVLTFGDLNNHESLVKENVITPFPGNIVEPKEAGKRQNIQGNIAQFNRVIKFRLG